MRKAGAFLLLLLIGFTVLLYAQEDDGDDPLEPDWDVYDMDYYTSGDQTFIMSAGTVFPAVFLNNGQVIEHNFSPPVGGTGYLSYNYYINSNVFLGGEFGGIFMPTLGRNTAYIIPLGFRAGYQFNVLRFELPVYATLGITWHRYLNLGYFGLFMKGGGSVYYRFNADWSFGVNVNWGWYPEWTSDRNKNIDGNIVDLTLGARYHF